MMTAQELRIENLDDAAIRSVLARNCVGRVAYVKEGDVEIRSVHYVYQDGSIYGRTSPDADILQLPEGASKVVFEVDEIASVFDWKSVIAKGHFEVLEANEDGSRDEAVELLRRVFRNTFQPGDPVPYRSVIFRIRIEQVTGRTSMRQ